MTKWKIYVPAAYLLVLSTFVWGVAASAREDAKRWLLIPGINMTVQPSEFLKLAFILSFAFHVAKINERFHHPLHILLLCVHAVIPVALVQFQGDSGTALMIFFVFLSMMFAAGIKLRYMLAAFVAVPVLIPLMWNYVLSNTQRNRILAVIGQSEADALGTLFQQNSAAQAIVAGGITGSGLFSDSLVFVPDIHNDFIFAFIGNAFGFLGCIAVLLVISVYCVKILITCRMANEKQGQLICAGVFAMIFVQSAVNILMCLSLMPVIGNSLPFLSSGGSSVLANYLGIGLVLSVYKHTKRKNKSDDLLACKYEGDLKT